jgi:glycosyltransferase involved in cell wall biosynthesis
VRRPVSSIGFDRVVRALILSYYFPPTGGSGVQRAVKFARYLPEFGIDPVVVAGSAKGGRWTPSDSSFEAELEAVECVRANTEPPWSGRNERLRRLFARPSEFGNWWTRAAAEAARPVGRVDVLLATMSPFESTRPAALIAGERRIPWVADLRDPWALDEMLVYPSMVHRALEQRRMRRELSSAAAVIMNTNEARARLLECFPEFKARPVEVIPNGFDSSDFGESPERREDGEFRIVHAGYLHTQLGQRQRRAGTFKRLLGGAVPGVDMLSRSHVPLIEALDRLKLEDGERFASISLHLAGVASDEDLSYVRGRPYVRYHGYLPHSETVRLLQSADLLYLPMHGLPGGGRATIVPGKTFEYLAAGRPILGALPEGDARDLLERMGNARLVPPGDVAALSDQVRQAFESPGTPLPPTATAQLARFERRTLTSQLAEILRAATSRGG